MVKKLLSVLLAILMVVSSVSCLFTASTVTASAEENLMANISASDWTSGWTGATGQEVNGAISILSAWRSVYTKVTLLPETAYSLTFKFGQVRVGDVRVYPASEITDDKLVSDGSTPTQGGTTNLASASITTSITSDMPVDGKFYEASESFTTTTETEYYIILDCFQCVDNKHCVLLKDLSITTKNYDSNVLNEDYMKTLTWNALWGAVTLDPKKADLDKSESFSGNSYVMTWGENSRYRDNYTIITLKPNTTYNFSFRYKAEGVEEIVDNIGFVPISKIDFSTIKGDYVSNHLIDPSTKILGKAGAYIEKQQNGVWNLVSTTFTTTTDTQYAMYLCVNNWVDGSFKTITLSDFNLEVEPNSINDIDFWGSTGGATITKSSDSCKGGSAVAVSSSNWRDTFVKVNLEANTYYNFDFNYKGFGGIARIKIFAANDIDSSKLGSIERVDSGLKTGATQLSETEVSATCDNTTWNNISVEFKTNENTEYYIVIMNNAGADAGSNFVVSDLNLAIDNGAALTDTANWGSTGGATITKSSDSCKGGSAVAVSSSNWRDTFVKVNLQANTSYSFDFIYKGFGGINRIKIFAANDIDSSKLGSCERVDECAIKNGVTPLSETEVFATCDNTTWNNISVEFKTNENTEYYIVIRNNAGDNAGSNFVVSDLNLVGETLPVVFDDLTDTVPSDWTSSWDGYKGTYDKFISLQNAWHTAYAKVTLAPNTKYDFTFNASNIKVADVRVFAASEIGNIAQLHNTNSWMVCNATDLVTAFSTTAPSESYETATEEVISQPYTVSASFTTNTTDTDYYILIDGGQFLNNGADYATYIFLKNLSLISCGEVVIDPNVLNDTAMSKLAWKALWASGDQTINSTVLNKSEAYSGDSYVMQWGDQVKYRDNYAIVKLEPNTSYKLSFRYKAAGIEEYVHYVGFVATNKVDFTSTEESIEKRLLDSNTEMLGRDYSATVEKKLNGKWNLVSTTFTTGEETEYVFFIGIGGWVDGSFSTITLSDFDLREYVDPNLLANATVANGDVRWSVGADSTDYYITGAEGKEDEKVTYNVTEPGDNDGDGDIEEGETVTVTKTNSRVYYYDSKTQGAYNGGYAWRIIISSDKAMHVYNPAVYGYITAKGLATNTKYTFSYIYTDTYHVKLADIYNASGSLSDIDVTTKILPAKDGTAFYAYMVTATFTTDAEGDYTIKLQTGRSNKYYIFDESSWAMTVSDLSLMPYEETPGEDIPDDANLLENPEDLPWKATWFAITHSTNGYNGTKAISLGGIQYHALYTMIDGFAPNTAYTLTFKYKSNAAIDVVGFVPAENVNLAMVNEKFSNAIVKDGNLVHYSNVTKVIDGTTWNTATVNFLTNDSTTYYLYFEGDSDANYTISDGIVISDISLTKNLDAAVNGIVADYDFENGNVGVISTTNRVDVPSVVEEDGNKYLKFTRTNDGITVPFWYDSDSKYVVSFDMKILSYPSDGSLEMRFKTSANNNKIQYSHGNIFTYCNDAYSLVTKDQNGKMLTAPVGLNYTENSQFDGFKHTFDNYSGWKRYEITIDPDYTYYTGIANFGFNANVAGWSIALDNIKVSALDGDFEADAEEKFEPTKYAAIRQKIVGKKQGIRVKSSIDTSLLNGDVKVVEYGTLAINNEKLGGAELVYDMINSDYDAKLGVAYSADNGTNVIFEQNDNVVTYTAVLTGLADYSTDYAVRGYMIAETADGERFVIYEETTKKVSVYDVVYAILNDGIENDDDIVANEIVAKNEAEYNTFVEENYTEEELTSQTTVNLKVSNSAAPIINNYRGFSGTVYHAFGFMEDDVTGRVYDEAMINTELDRLEDAGVHYVRTRYQSQWTFDDATGYDWNSGRFNYFLNYARALQERDMEVILQVGWHFDFVSQEGTYSIRENDYFNGEGADRYNESAGVDFSGKSANDIRIIKAAYRYAYMMANTVKLAKAKGINNINYFSYFVEPSNSYSSDGLDSIFAGHDKEEYVLFCRTMRNALEDVHNITGIKHMGPNEASYSKLTEYVVANDPTLFDILTAHHYPEEGDVKTNYKTYYKTMTNNTNTGILPGNGYMTDFNDYKSFLNTVQSSNPNAEFWSDEFNIKDFDAYKGRGTSSFYRGLATAMGGIVAQQSGIQNTILWMSFDQLWTDDTGGTPDSKSEFMNGIHQCGNAPSLFLSDQPYAQYYATSLFSKYNGYKNGTVYKTNLTETETKGVYVGAVKLEDGSWTVSVINMNNTAVNINVAFDTAINQTLYRHIVSADKEDTYKNAVLPDVDKTFENVATSFNDVLPAGSMAIYTGVK